MVVDRINRAILNFIRKKSGAQRGALVADSVGLKLVEGAATHWSVAWGDVQRVVAFQSAGFVGDTITLAIETGAEPKLMTEEQDGWSDIVSALPAHLPGARLHEEWALELVAGESDATVAVFDRG